MACLRTPHGHGTPKNRPSARCAGRPHLPAGLGPATSVAGSTTLAAWVWEAWRICQQSPGSTPTPAGKALRS